MKSLLTLLAFSLCGICFAADAASPRVIDLTGAPFPKAQVVSVDVVTGTLIFSYLKADGTKADSGNSIARFTPLAPLPKAKESDPITYPSVSDVVLSSAIAAKN